MSEPNLSSFTGSVTDLLRGDDKPSEYGKIILPLTVERHERDDKSCPVLGSKGKGILSMIDGLSQ